MTLSTCLCAGLQGCRDVVEAVEEAVSGVIVDVEADGQVGMGGGAGAQVDGDDLGGGGFDGLTQCAEVSGGDDAGEEPAFGGVAAEDVGEAWREDHAKSEVVQCPYDVLAR
ncbi:hypothetical protein LRS71_21755 [Rhodococcus pyridinivorans]|nr:hypothetical protein [Rhodococcus pyridinivorans]MCD5422149.1 hypothetical protein [Rhodococcus pyridinivorans]